MCYNEENDNERGIAMPVAQDFLSHLLAVNAGGGLHLIRDKKKAFHALIEATQMHPKLEQAEQEQKITLAYSAQINTVIHQNDFLKSLFKSGVTGIDTLNETGVTRLEQHLLNTYQELIEDDDTFLQSYQAALSANDHTYQTMMQNAKRNRQQLINNTLALEVRLKAAFEYGQLLNEMRAHVQQARLTNVVESSHPSSRKVASGGQATYPANFLMTRLHSEWNFMICENTENALKQIRITPPPVNAQVSFAAEDDKSQVLVGLGQDSSGIEECIIATRQYPNVQVKLKQELYEARVVDLTTDPLNEQQQIDSAMMQAQMLLKNYKKDMGWTRIVIEHPKMAMRIHAALLLMLDDSPAKGLVIDNLYYKGELPKKDISKYINEASIAHYNEFIRPEMRKITYDLEHNINQPSEGARLG